MDFIIVSGAVFRAMLYLSCAKVTGWSLWKRCAIWRDGRHGSPNSTPVDSQKAEQRKQAIDVLEYAPAFIRQIFPAGWQSGFDISHRAGWMPISSRSLCWAMRRVPACLAPAQRQFPKELILLALPAFPSAMITLDYFRDRVMFPIQNRQGRVIAFGARLAMPSLNI